MVVTLLVISPALSNSLESYQNELHGVLEFECPSGYGLVRVKSTYSSPFGNSDRQWTWECTKVNVSHVSAQVAPQLMYFYYSHSLIRLTSGTRTTVSGLRISMILDNPCSSSVQQMHLWLESGVCSMFSTMTECKLPSTG